MLNNAINPWLVCFEAWFMGWTDVHFIVVCIHGDKFVDGRTGDNAVVIFSPVFYDCISI